MNKKDSANKARDANGSVPKATEINMMSGAAKTDTPVFLWAAAVSFAQVYSGVHYPADILLGAILGTCIGYGIATALLTTIHSFKQWCPQN